MPLYVYQSDDGREIERVMGMRDHHPETIDEGGVTYRRVYGNHRVNGDPVSGRYPWVDQCNGRVQNWPGKRDPLGRSIVRNKREDKMLQRMTNTIKD